MSELARRLREAQRLAQLGSWELDLTTNSLVWSDEIYRIFEIDPAKFGATYEAFLDAVHPDERDAVAMAYETSVANKKPYDIIHRLQMADGRIKWVHELCETEYGADGAPLLSRGTVQDITLRKSTEDALHESQITLAALLKTSPEAVIVTDENGRIKEFSTGAEAIFGYTASEVIGGPLERLMPGRLRKAHSNHMREFGNSPGTGQMMNERSAILGLRKNGEEFPAEASISKLTLPGGMIFATVMRDVSQQNAARDELIKAKLAAESASETKSRFIANMSHELRTPLNAIIGFSEMLMNRTQLRLDDARCGEYAADIHESGLHLLRVINDILDISRLDIGNTQPAEEPLTVTDVIEASMRMVRGRASESGVSLGEEIASGLPGLTADRRLLIQAMLNIASNAIKFTRPGGSVIAGARRARDGGIDFFVRDTGIGMRPEDLVRVGEPFMQADSSHTRRFDGAGLGLSIVKRIAEIHGGRLIVESEVGKGTTATVQFPASRVSELQRQTG
ncbi:MAG TPA: ATP-binding protein [Alphaproteobacteria bacterium]|nr:ATP-binding protein [Alphaproteobacteria bacterium]